jgi:hypothetical protein
MSRDSPKQLSMSMAMNKNFTDNNYVVKTFMWLSVLDF